MNKNKKVIRDAIAIFRLPQIELLESLLLINVILCQRDFTPVFRSNLVIGFALVLRKSAKIIVVDGDAKVHLGKLVRARTLPFESLLLLYYLVLC